MKLFTYTKRLSFHNGHKTLFKSLFFVTLITYYYATWKSSRFQNEVKIFSMGIQNIPCIRVKFPVFSLSEKST